MQVWSKTETIVEEIAENIIQSYERELDAFLKEYGMKNRTTEEIASLFVFWRYKRLVGGYA